MNNQELKREMELQNKNQWKELKLEETGKIYIDSWFDFIMMPEDDAETQEREWDTREEIINKIQTHQPLEYGEYAILLESLRAVEERKINRDE